MKIAPVILCVCLSLPAWAETKVTFNGTGCPQGSGARYAIDGDTLQLTFPADFSVESYPASSPSEGRKNCIASVRMEDFSQTYTLEAVSFSAYASLPRPTKASIGFSYWFEGQAYTTSVDFAHPGPMEDSWNVEDEVPFHRQLWKPCGLDRALNINSRISVTRTPADSAFAQLETVAFKIKRRNCQRSVY